MKFGGGGGDGSSSGGSSSIGNVKQPPTTPLSPTVSPAPTPYTDYDYLLGLFAPLSGREKLQDTTTSQYKAMNWLLYDDPATYDIRTADEQALLERYIAVHFYFSTTV